jgi:putative flavoprotein involved in K+ transport
VVQQRGVTPAPGLYVLGLPWMHTRGSALLGWVGEDAAYLAQQIAALQAKAAGSPRTGSRSPGVSVLLG